MRRKNKWRPNFSDAKKKKIANHTFGRRLQSRRHKEPSKLNIKKST
jgi:hypothetical protein